MVLTGTTNLRSELEGIASAKSPTFVDVFAGCGGLSLGLMQSGWRGLFAIEKNTSPFQTLSKNLLSENSTYSLDWPEWLPREPLCAIEAISVYREQLRSLNGHLDVLVGGPPCQGFSSAGKRAAQDPRNRLFEVYLEYVDLLRPKMVLIENVRGMTLDFRDPTQAGRQLNYSERLMESLNSDYHLYSRLLDLSHFGVPQNRTRFFIIGIKKGQYMRSGLPQDPFDWIEAERLGFLMTKGLTSGISAKAAISDLEVSRNGAHESTESPGFKAISYNAPITPFQKLMRHGCNAQPTDTRLANHRSHIRDRFAEIIELCHDQGRLSVSLSREAREGYGLKKQAIRVLDPDRPAPTVTSMPDDLIHYKEPRTLTVRENARLQSFPDWFEFLGQYTTGGHRRRHEVPRYTQVANAVPPLAAEAIGRSLIPYLT